MGHTSARPMVNCLHGVTHPGSPSRARPRAGSGRPAGRRTTRVSLQLQQGFSIGIAAVGRDGSRLVAGHGRCQVLKQQHIPGGRRAGAVGIATQRGVGGGEGNPVGVSLIRRFSDSDRRAPGWHAGAASGGWWLQRIPPALTTAVGILHGDCSCEGGSSSRSGQAASGAWWLQHTAAVGMLHGGMQLL